MANSNTTRGGRSRHGLEPIRGLDAGLSAEPGPMIKDPRAYFTTEESIAGLSRSAPARVEPGRFGRIFRDSDYRPDPLAVHDLAETMREETIPVGDHPTLPIGFVYLGQFIDHDLTLDTTSTFERQEDPQAVQNFRTPNLDLDCLYGSGPGVNPYLYENGSPPRLLLDKDHDFDVPRNSQGVALIGDPRNDENHIVSQLQLAFIKFHNAVVDHLVANGHSGDSPGQLLKKAQRTVRWHFQWIVLHEFLPLMTGSDVVRDILADGRRFYKWEQVASFPFIPIEFAAAAYRMGHTLLREDYVVNDGQPSMNLFALPSFGNPRLSDASLKIDWRYFFALPGGAAPQKSRRFDAKITPAVYQLPFVPPSDPPPSLAERNMLRGITFRLPSGQEVASWMGLKPLDARSLGVDQITGLNGRTPLWFYILKESEIHCGGLHLGAVGGRIVAEVLIGILEGNPGNFLHQQSDPSWTPTLPAAAAGDFTMADLIRFAGA